jgi:polysaccharide biosynthesis transport protein
MNIDLVQLPEILKRRWKIVVLTALVCMGLAFVYTLSLKPAYLSTAEILLDPKKFEPVSNDIAANSPAPVDSSQNVDSQIYVMNSYELLSAVVKKLDLVNDPYFVGGGGLLSSLLGRSTNVPAAQREPMVVEGLRKKLLIERAEKSLVFSITATHYDPQKSAEIANAFAETYLETVNTNRSDALLKTSMGLQVQAQELRDRMMKAQAAVESFKTANGMISTAEKGMVSDQQILTVSQQLADARIKVEQDRSLFEQAQKLMVTDVAVGAVPDSLQSNTLTALRTRYAQLLDRVAELSSSLGSNHPDLQAARSQAESLKSSINAELERSREAIGNSYQRSKANLDALQAHYDALKKTNDDNGDARTRLAQLEGEAASVRDLYTNFLTRAETISRDQAVESGDSRIISLAVPAGQSSTASRLMLLIAALLFGTAAGSGLAIVRDLFGGEINSARDLLAITKAPVLVRFSAHREPAISMGSRWSGLEGLMGQRRNSDPAQIDKMGFLRIMHVLRSALDQSRAATVIFVSSGPLRGQSDIVERIARTMSLHGEDVYLTNGALRTAPKMVQFATGSVKLRTDSFSAAPPPAGIDDVLLFERVQAQASGMTSNLTHALAKQKGRGRMMFVDACDTQASQILPLLLGHADAILLVSELGQTKTRDLEDLALSLEPWRERLIGNIIIGEKG